MRVAVVSDSPYTGCEDQDSKREVAQHVEGAEYEVAEAFLAYGHDVLMVGVHDDFRHLLARLHDFEPDIVFNCAEGYHDDLSLDYLFPALLEAEGYRHTGAPPIALLKTRNKAMSKKILAHPGFRVPGFETHRPGEDPDPPPVLAFPRTRSSVLDTTWPTPPSRPAWITTR